MSVDHHHYPATTTLQPNSTSDGQAIVELLYRDGTPAVFTAVQIKISGEVLNLYTDSLGQCIVPTFNEIEQTTVRAIQTGFAFEHHLEITSGSLHRITVRPSTRHGIRNTKEVHRKYIKIRNVEDGTVLIFDERLREWKSFKKISGSFTKSDILPLFFMER